MKKLYIATYCTWESYGSMLQALALQKKLESMGYEAPVLQCQPEPPETLPRKLPKGNNGKRLLYELHKALIYPQRNRRYRATRQFLGEHVRILRFDSLESLRRSPPKADAYLAGSDQIWKSGSIEPFFYLDFGPPETRRISYAASLGAPRMTPEQAERIQGFDFISLREYDAAALISRWTGRPVSVNVDPVFLLDREQWRAYEAPYPGLDKPYLLVYAIYWDRRQNKQLRQLHRQTGWDIVAVSGGIQRVYANRRIYDAGPAQFLWLVDHAQAVVTSSFHGTAMAILFDKPLSAVIDPAAPSRITCLLETLGVESLPMERLLSERKADPVDARILEERMRSEAYLTQALAGD